MKNVKVLTKELTNFYGDDNQNLPIVIKVKISTSEIYLEVLNFSIVGTGNLFNGKATAVINTGKVIGTGHGLGKSNRNGIRFE